MEPKATTPRIESEHPTEPEKPASIFDAPALLDSFNSIVPKLVQLPSFFSKPDSILPSETKAEKLAEGSHKNANGSRLVADAAGRITEFVSAPSSDYPQGAAFKNIKYDAKNEMLSYQAPSGHIFTRTTQTDKDGFGTWMVTDAQGRQTSYAGSNAWTWRGKAVASEDGFRNMVGSGQKNGTTYARMADGSFNESKSTSAEKPAAVPTAAKDTQARVVDRVLQKIEASPHPVAELSAALQNMENLRDASVTRRADGRHQVNMHFDQATQMPAINANIRGFRPGPTNVGENVSFTLSHSQNGVRLDNMEGFSGSVTGPRGRVRPSWNNGMHIGRDQNGTPFVDVDSTVQGPFRLRSSSNRFGESNFPAGSPIRQLMHHPDVLSDAASALRMFQNKDDVLQASIRKTAPGQFDVATQARAAKDIPINQAIGQTGMTVNSLHLDAALSGSISHDSAGAKFANMKGMTVKVNGGLLGDMTVTPKTVALQNNAEGVPIVRLQVELKGTMVPIDIPVSKLKEYRTRGN